MKEELSVIYSDDNIKNKYDVSIASLGDIYKSINQSRDSPITKKNKCAGSESPHLKKEKKLKDLLKDPDPELIEKPDYSYNSEDQDVSRLINKSIYEKIKVDEYRNEKQHMHEEKNKTPHIENLFVDMAHDLPENNTQINVKCLKLANGISNYRKYSHVKSGKINPVKSSYSIKPVVDNNIKRHQESLKDFVLEADKVEINLTDVKKLKSPRNFITKYMKADEIYKNTINADGTLYREPNENVKNENQNFNQTNYVVIGEGYNPQANNKTRNNYARPKSSVNKNPNQNKKAVNNNNKNNNYQNKNLNNDLNHHIEFNEINSTNQDKNPNTAQFGVIGANTARAENFNSINNNYDNNKNNIKNQFNNSNQQSISYYENKYGKSLNKSAYKAQKQVSETRPSSKENRNLLKKVEEFYSNTKNLLSSSDNNLPAKVNLNQLVKSSENIEKSLVEFQHNILEPQYISNNSSVISKNNNHNNTGARPKSANYMLKNSINKHKKREAKNFRLDMNPEERKKFEEKLELLHIEMRNTLDNLNQVGNSGEKFHELTKRWQELTQTIMTLSKHTCNSFKNSNSNFAPEFQEMDNLSYNNNNNEFNFIEQQQNNFNDFNNNQNLKENYNRTNSLQDNIAFHSPNNASGEQELFRYSNLDSNKNQSINNNNNINVSNMQQNTQTNNNFNYKNPNVINNYSKESIPIYNEVDEVINVLNTQKNRTSSNLQQTISNDSNMQKTIIDDKKQSSKYSIIEGNNMNSTGFHRSKGRFFDPQTMKNFEFSVSKNPESRLGNTSSNNFYNPASNYENRKEISNLNNQNYNYQPGHTYQNFNDTERNFTNRSSQQNFYNNNNPINQQKNDLYSISSYNNNQFKSTQARTNNFSGDLNNKYLSNNNSITNFNNNNNNFAKQTENSWNPQFTNQNNKNEINENQNNFNSYEHNPHINDTQPSQIINNNYNKEEEERMKIMKEYQDKFIIKNQGAVFDERFTAYDIKMPLEYYHSYAKANEPPKERDWCIRPHHTESIIKNKEVIPDDLMNTKYISYYAEAEKPEPPATRLHLLNEVIGGLQGNIDMLKKKLHQKAVTDKDFKNVYKKLLSLKEEAKNEFVPGKFFEKSEGKAAKSTDMLANKTEGKNYSEFFNQNEDIGKTNYIIQTYETLLGELRNLEKDKVLRKRKEEYEKIRPPIEKWWEMKNKNFQSEFRRNTVVLNSGPEYFKKLQLLQSKNLY